MQLWSIKCLLMKSSSSDGGEHPLNIGEWGVGIPHEILQVPLDKYWLDFHVLCLFENDTVNLIFCITQHLKTWKRISLQVRYEVADGRKDKISTLR